MFNFVQTLQNGVPELSAGALFFVFFFGTFVSEDAACLLAGSAAANGQISFVLALAACSLGIFAGDVLLYTAGRIFAMRIFESRFVKRFISERTKKRASEWLEKNVVAAVFLSRFVSGLRLPTYLLAGALRTNFSKFALYFLLAAAAWTPILVGSTMFSQAFLFQKNSLLSLIIVAVVIRFAFKYSSRKNRRLLVGRIKRITNWEFWPLPIFYAPVVLYILWLAIKHGSLTVFTAANPAMPAGGFKGESKNEIYTALQKSRAATEFLLKFTLLKKDSAKHEKLLKAWKFIDENALKFPLVIKPDAGERGKDVCIIHNTEELESAILNANVDLLLQEFAPGKEAGIFYYRFPGEARGQIFSITEKCFPVLTGNGKSTLEELILNDPRAVCIAQKYFEQNRENLDDVPAVAEKVKIIDVGTHSRGAIFLDGGWLKTEALEQKIDEICRGYKGFYFGRFDIRAASFDDLKRGEHFKIIELNGVTSESTNIYDSQYSLPAAYRILFAQWRLAFEIGAENCQKRGNPMRLFSFMKLLVDRKSSRPPLSSPFQIRPASAL